VRTGVKSHPSIEGPGWTIDGKPLHQHDQTLR